MSEREERMKKIVNEHIAYAHFDLINDSHGHSVPKNSETHFTLLLVSDHFLGMTLIKRHKMVMEWFKDEFMHGLHALSLQTWTEKEWNVKSVSASLTPPACKGGKKQD